MGRHIAIIQGHPGPAGHHLLNTLADAYAHGATRAGHEVRRTEVAQLEFPLLLVYRWYFGAYGIRSFERSMLSFAGIKPIRESLYGLAFADQKKRARWIDDMRRRGERGDQLA